MLSSDNPQKHKGKSNHLTKQGLMKTKTMKTILQLTDKQLDYIIELRKQIKKFYTNKKQNK